MQILQYLHKRADIHASELDNHSVGLALWSYAGPLHKTFATIPQQIHVKWTLNLFFAMLDKP
jgi:hypothetical protein